MTRPRIALAAAEQFTDLDGELVPLSAALAARGVDAEAAVWDDRSVDWSAFDAVVVRATWDYVHRLDDFLAWAAHVASVTRLANPLEVLRWNTNKRYLECLEAAGLPVVHTDWLDPGDTFTAPTRSTEYVVKPAVSAGSRDTHRYTAGEDDAAAERQARALLAAGRTVMVQPYVDAIDSEGETAMLYFAGEWSHSIRKGALLERGGAPVLGAFKRENVSSRRPSDVERATAERVLDALPWSRHTLTYARVDLVPGDNGPVVIEIELTEPSMFLDHSDDAVDRFAAAIAALVAGP
jgi:glutathione synthase/RimK-type ligase-like ATP-grasp enzyme